MFCDQDIFKILFYIGIYVKIKYFYILYVVFDDDENVEISEEHLNFDPTVSIA